MSNIDSIASHPIFQGLDCTQDAAPRFLFTSHHGTRMVVLQGGLLRWCSVTASSFNSMTIDFFQPESTAPQKAILSNSGEFICVYTNHTIEVIEIPWGYVTPSPSMVSKFQLFSYNNKDDDGYSPIKQVLFHPEAYKDSCLVVLYDNGTISLMDVTQITKTITLNKRVATFGIDTQITDIESICFSKDGWTLYALSISDGGDIYAFYPCLPQQLEVKREKITSLLHESVLLYESLKLDTDRDVKRNVIRQVQFVNKLNGLLTENEKNSNEDFIEIEQEYRLIRGQGPFTIDPYPERLYSATALEISTLPINSNNELMCMIFDDGSIALLFKDLPLTMSWDVDNYVHNNSFSLVELMQLKDTDVKRIVSYPDTYGQFFIFGDSSLFLVHTHIWSDLLAKAIDNSNLNELLEMNFTSKLDFFETTNGITKCSPCKWRGRDVILFITKEDVYMHPVEMRKSGILGNNKPVLVNNEELKHQEYKTSFKQPVEELMALNKLFQQQCSMGVSKLIAPEERQVLLNNENNEVQLELLSDVSKEVISKIGQGQNLALNLHHRLLEQQYELTRQLKIVHTIMSKQSDLRRKSEEQSRRWDDQTSRSSQLIKRLQDLDAKILEINNSPKLKEYPINDKELEWFKEIRNQVLKFNSFVHNQRDAQEELNHLKKDLARISKETSQLRDEKSDKEWDELRDILKHDAQIIQECNKELLSTTEAL
ncbi:hypothetical protein NCAS_0A09210 [Naumovozyma castellii]|uniref:Nucleoporin Nup82 n=1 Tax=Naumovozyma castellii TaxID=27288 RepID=G0V7N1_NAUCA|nr:hypothetical protein NCAS_0A09210 [Naumovozyma castellii CBS 4309]CCC67479.1 hypothetical protein NCAS_0A09210 [Naumovozyma castellii CBS 4309]